MLFGRLPAPAAELALPSASWAPIARDSSRAAAGSAATSSGDALTSRRALFAGLGGVALGLAASKLGSLAQLPESAQATAPLPDWAQDMLRLPEPELVRLAGEFERKSMRFQGARELGACFERLYVAARHSRRPEAGMAAACAVRSLERVGRLDLLDDLLPDLLRRRDWEEALEAARLAYRRNPGHGRVG